MVGDGVLAEGTTQAKAGRTVGKPGCQGDGTEPTGAVSLGVQRLLLSWGLGVI